MIRKLKYPVECFAAYSIEFILSKDTQVMNKKFF